MMLTHVPVFKITAGPNTETIKIEASPAQLPSELVRMAGRISRKLNIIIINNTLRSSKISIGPPIFAKLLDECPEKWNPC